MEKFVYFTTPIWKGEKKEFLKSLNKLSDQYIKKARKRNKDLIKQTKDFGITHNSDALLADNNFRDFHNYIGQKCWEFLDWSGFDMSKYKTFLEQSWVQEFAKNGGGHHGAHIHWNTHVNAFYFLKCGENTSYPLFHDPRAGARTTKLYQQENVGMTPATEVIHIKPSPGDLIIFPGYLEHEFAVDHGKQPFRFIHVCMTAVLKGMAKQ